VRLCPPRAGLSRYRYDLGSGDSAHGGRPEIFCDEPRAASSILGAHVAHGAAGAVPGRSMIKEKGTWQQSDMRSLSG
jgi:hypothetical protein